MDLLKLFQASSAAVAELEAQLRAAVAAEQRLAERVLEKAHRNEKMQQSIDTMIAARSQQLTKLRIAEQRLLLSEQFLALLQMFAASIANADCATQPAPITREGLFRAQKTSITQMIAAHTDESDEAAAHTTQMIIDALCNYADTTLVSTVIAEIVKSS